ncbi:MAG TPA: DNA repair protein RecN [Acidimicrobiia bacterium]|nr:DNA repair protein RecN [Acidimicrobiia bacterium]
MTSTLRELHVSDLGIVDDLTLLLGPGLTAITGETGAGKTLLVEALDLLLGGRADLSLVRRGATEARVEGRFEDERGTEHVLARVLPADGRTRAYIDGRLATVGELADVGGDLAELHAQHSQQRLFAPATQREAVDRFAGDAARDALGTLRSARDEVRRLDAELGSLGGDERARARELDLLRFQIEEIDAAGVSDAGEDVTLEAEEALLADAAAHRDALGVAYRALEGPALEALGEAIGALEDRVPFRELVERIGAAQAEVADVERELRLASEGIPDDPGRLDEVRGRRRALRELQRKYGDTLAEVVAFGDLTRRRVVELEGYEQRAGELETERRAAEEAAQGAAATLSEIRGAAAGPLGAAVTGHLRELAMPHAVLTVDVTPSALTDDGADTVTFLLAPNPGEPPKPVARAASGGELSRAMLALRLVLTEGPPTLVFDEVDAGIGGEAGTAVGRLLADLSSRHQVLCVTHLAQVAAHAQTQVVVDKREVDGRTVTAARAVEGDARVAELSRMLAGLVDSAHAQRHAAELIERARVHTS